MQTPPSTSPQSPLSSSWAGSDLGFATSAFTKARSPQFTPNNISSSQVANASADGALCLTEMDPNIVDTTPGYRVDHKPPSNVSTETAGTDDTAATITDLFKHHAGLLGLGLGLGPIPYMFEAPAHPPLTSSNMALHQRELEQSYPSSVWGWVDGAGIGSRFAAGNNDNNNTTTDNSKHPSSVAHSLLTAATAGRGAHGGRGHSVAGSSTYNGGDWMFVAPPMRTDEDIVAAGAWCEEERLGY